MRDTALAYLRAGLCVLPANLADKHPAVGSWKPYQQRLPTEEELSRWFDRERPLCLVCGAVSGHLEMIDFDCAGEFFPAWLAFVVEATPSLVGKLLVERSQHGGRHVVYRCRSPVGRSVPLARRKELVDGPEEVVRYGKPYRPRQDADGRWHIVLTLIETRGEGGLFLCAPSPGYTLVSGDFAALPVLDERQRDTLLEAAWSLNEYVPPTVDEHRFIGDPLGARPGDEFNDHGDVRAVLRRHGWSLVKGGDNEYWRRPGKASGSSATLKDRVFYVFSQNAAPFEAERAYAPFTVYALLEHGGDYSAAATRLRQEGFGGDPGDETVDISGITGSLSAEPKDRVPAATDPGPIPEHLFRVPGFVTQVMDFTLSAAPYPNVGLAFCGALALQSFLAGRKVCTSGDLRTNLYLLALASSGTGKEFPRKVNSHILFRVGLAGSLGDKFASGEGIQDTLLRSGMMLFQNDEMDGVLRQINLDHENRRESIPNILLTLYTSASDIYPTRVKAGQKEVAHIDQPHLTLFGTATPQFFYESLSRRMLTNGFFARLNIVDVGNRGPGQRPRSVREVPESVIATAQWWVDFQPGYGNLQSFHPEPREVPFDPDAGQAVDELRRLTETEYMAADQANDEVARTAWSRTCEHATKLALIYACSENPHEPRITLAAIEWATAFAMHQTRRQLYLATTYVADNPFHAECLKLLRRLRGRAEPVSRSELLRFMRCKAAEFDQIVGTLLQQGELITVPITTKTKPAQGYRIP